MNPRFKKVKLKLGVGLTEPRAGLTKPWRRFNKLVLGSLG
jgi:hypothetical protein